MATASDAKQLFYKGALKSIDIMCIGVHVLYAAFFLYTNVIPLFIFNVLSVLMYIILLIFLKEGKNQVLFLSLMLAEIMLHVILTTVLLGTEFGFSLQMLTIMSTAPLYPFKKSYSGWILFALAGGIFITLYLYSEQHQPIYISDRISSLRCVIYIFNLVVTASPLALEAYTYKKNSEKIESMLSEKAQMLTQIATTDPLTGLLNRRSMDEELRLAQQKFNSSKKPFCVAIADIDDFKKINDHYGHDCGDYVLKQIASIFTDTLRNTDKVSRWGGEEFLILLTDTDSISAEKVLERLREQISGYDYMYNDMTLHVSMTFGMSCKQDNELDSMIKDADEWLYFGKTNGKNQVAFKKQ